MFVPIRYRPMLNGPPFVLCLYLFRNADSKGQAEVIYFTKMGAVCYVLVLYTLKKTDRVRIKRFDEPSALFTYKWMQYRYEIWMVKIEGELRPEKKLVGRGRGGTTHCILLTVIFFFSSFFIREPEK